MSISTATFPDPETGDHPDENAWQAETIVMMNLAEAQKFVISANIHGGVEVVNYPWDTWSTLHADDQWYIDISRDFADSAQYYSPSGYMTYKNNGITNGYAWYEVDGGRQDYMNWWHGCREVTLEISNVMLLPGSQLPAHWVYLRSSFLHYLENGLYGVRGIVTDSSTGLPMEATITVVGHDFDNSQVTTDPEVGNYHRMLEAGTYDLEFSATGYYSKTVSDVSVSDGNAVRVDVALAPLTDDPSVEFVEYTSDAVNPGDTVTMPVTLINNGGGNAYNVGATLSTDDAYVTMIQDYSTFPTLTAVGGTGLSLSDYSFAIAPSCTTLHLIDFHLDITADGGYVTSADFQFLVGDRVVFFADNFSFDQGWTGLGGSGEWTIGPAVGGSGSDGSGGPDPDVDHSPGSDNHVLGNDLNPGTGGDYNSGLSTTYWVTSPMFDCSGFTGVELRYYRWLGVESNSYDHASLQVHDGSDWVTVFENGSTNLNESSWSEQYHDLSAYADGNQDFQIRFGIGSTDGSVQYCGWNIDDLELKGYGQASQGSPDLAWQPLEIYDSLHLGDSLTDSVTIVNDGESLLRIRFSTPHTWLDIDTAQHNVSPGDSLTVTALVTTDGLTPGDYTGTLDFTSNDPVHSDGSIPVYLHIYAPDIAVEVSSIEETLETDQQSSRPLTIVNNGPGRLEYEISRQMFSGKNRGQLTEQPRSIIGYHAGDPARGDGPEPQHDKADRNFGGPDNWGYSWVDSDEPGGPDFEWIDISSVGMEISGLGDDDTSGAIAIGFVFPFYENSYTELYVGSNGLITFGSASTERSNVDIPNSGAPDNMIAMWWDDLDPRRGGHIYYYHDVTNERFIVTFDDIRNYYSTTGTGSLTFQAVLHTSGKIILQYETMDPGDDYAGLTGATIGIENAVGDDGLEVVYNAAYMHDSLAVSINAASWLSVDPGSGEIDPFSSEIVNVNFDAADMDEGAYDGLLTISSNDPDTPAIDIDITLTVDNQLAPPESPVLVSPEDGAPDVEQPINLDWQDIDGVDSYQLVIDDDTLFASPAADTTLVAAACELSGLDEGVTFYWHVRAHNAAGWGDWSDRRGFTTALTYLCGDPDGNGLVNILDITYLINFLYKDGPPPVSLPDSDVNSDDTVNVLDITAIINYLYMGGPELNCP